MKSTWNKPWERIFGIKKEAKDDRRRWSGPSRRLDRGPSGRSATPTLGIGKMSARRKGAKVGSWLEEAT